MASKRRAGGKAGKKGTGKAAPAPADQAPPAAAGEAKKPRPRKRPPRPPAAPAPDPVPAPAKPQAPPPDEMGASLVGLATGGAPHDDDEAAAAGRPAHKPTEGTRKAVRTMSAYQIPQDEIAEAVGVTAKTLRKHYVLELKQGLMNARLRVHRTAYEMATSGENTAMTIFWLKVKSGWREPPKQHQAVDAEGRPINWVVLAPPMPGSTAEWQQKHGTPTAH